MSLLREAVKVWQCSKHPNNRPLYLLKSINLFLTVKILLNPVSIKLQNGLVITVLKEN